MPISPGRSLIIIAVAAACTFLTRALPFLVFSGERKIPDVILYLGRVLTPGVIARLVIYCLKDVSFLSGSHGIPELIAVGVTALLHFCKRNNLLSIGVGTVLYMFLIQAVF